MKPSSISRLRVVATTGPGGCWNPEDKCEDKDVHFGQNFIVWSSASYVYVWKATQLETDSLYHKRRWTMTPWSRVVTWWPSTGVTVMNDYSEILQDEPGTMSRSDPVWGCFTWVSQTMYNAVALKVQDFSWLKKKSRDLEESELQWVISLDCPSPKEGWLICGDYKVTVNHCLFWLMRLPPLMYIYTSHWWEVTHYSFLVRNSCLYYSSIIPNSFGYLLFSKLCQHNLSRAIPEPLNV